MKFIFKEQDYQVKAVDSVVNVFKGQKYHSLSTYTRDLGILSSARGEEMVQTHLPLAGAFGPDLLVVGDGDDYTIGYANAPIELNDATVLKNVQEIQAKNNLPVSSSLNKSKTLSPLDIDVEMETGTGKTYVYIRTMFELNRTYGFSKFIVIVPTIAIKQGVKKSFEQTQDHFLSIYGKKARFFVYDSKRLSDVDEFARSNQIEVMIINIQAFNSASKRLINTELDEFQSRRPIDVIKKTRPILILDEPQKMDGKATRESIPTFNPLFTIKYSATLREKNCCVYSLDALDAYNNKLVKKIEVKSVKGEPAKGTIPYLYLDHVQLIKGKDPQAVLGFLKRKDSGAPTELVKALKRGDSIYELSGNMEAYKNGYVIDEIRYGDANSDDEVVLLNGVVLKPGLVLGNADEDFIRRIQIRETIESHLQKERKNFYRNIKTLSLFFIDEVKKYKDYSRTDQKGEYARIFEEEYQAAVDKILNETTAEDIEYKEYLNQFKPYQVHGGYFSEDKYHHFINSTENKSSGIKGEEKISDDESAYEKILNGKEKLLSKDEPLRFIFSHSALREGWDNPNIFQICTLRNTRSTISRRQEVGRGLRIAVDWFGNRQDTSVLGEDFFKVNKLTVISNEDYGSFVAGLQTEIKESLSARPSKFDKNFFVGKFITDSSGNNTQKISEKQATVIYQYLVHNNYIDSEEHLTGTFKHAWEGKTIEVLPEDLEPYRDSLINLMYKGEIPIDNGSKPRLENKRNDHFKDEDFQKLWSDIRKKCTYRVELNSESLIADSIKEIKDNLKVHALTYSVTTGETRDSINRDDVGNVFVREANGNTTKLLNTPVKSHFKYDLVGVLANRTGLTRKTIVTILKGTKEKLSFFRQNPEEYISNVASIIEHILSVDGKIHYILTEDKYPDDIFDGDTAEYNPNKVLLEPKKSVQDYVFVEGTAISGDSNEMKFAKSLEDQTEIKVYAKLPNKYKIPTPVGDYTPDWAIVYEKDGEKGVYFVAETKGSNDPSQLREIEKVKIDCAKKLYNSTASGVHYEQIHDITDLINDILNQYEK